MSEAIQFQTNWVQALANTYDACERQPGLIGRIDIRQVVKDDKVKRNFIISTSDTSLTTADQSLDGQDISRIEVTFLLLGKEGLDFLIFIRDDAVF